MALLSTLFTTLLTRSDAQLSAVQRAVLTQAREQDWLDALETLRPHKVAPLLAFKLEEQGLLGQLPNEARSRLSEALRETRQLNMLLLLTSASVLRSVPEAEPPLVLKGLLLADSYYPEPGTRPMGDIDLVAAPGQFLGLCTRLEQQGFTRSLEVTDGDHARTYVDARGTLCDAHERIPEFDGLDFAQLSEPCTMRKVRGVKALRLTPDAMLAHLVMHMHGHLPSVGPVLLWLIDVALVLRAHGGELSAQRVRRLCQTPGSYAFLLRVLGLLARHGQPVPAAFARDMRRVLPLTLASVLRQRRVTPWGIPKPRGFARIVLARLALKEYRRFQQPHVSDLLWWPVDALCTRVSPLLLRHA